MPGRMVLVLVIAAFCAGLLTDRVYRALNAPAVNLDPVPLPPSDAAVQPGAITMQNCLSGAIRHGMTRDQAIHACQEIVN